MQMAFYKGPATDTWHQVGHRLTCWFTGSPYSHCELVIDGVCLSSSSRDGGVRAKRIDLASGKWDVASIADPTGALADNALQWFADHSGQAYDWAGIARFVLPFLPHHRRQWFCSEACAVALGLPDPADWTPGMLAVKFPPP